MSKHHATRGLAWGLLCVMLLACSAPAVTPPLNRPARLQGQVTRWYTWQGLGGATVWAGSLQTPSADPKEKALSAAQEFADPRNADQTLSVWHAFDEGEEPVLTERRPLKHPLGPRPEDRYIYLKPGEFYFEELPEGSLTLRAEKDGLSSAAHILQLAPGLSLEKLKLNIPLPPLNEDRAAVAWTALAPASGFTVQTGTNPRFLDASSEARLSLRGLPGWPGGSISELDVRLSWQEPGKKKASEAAYRLPLEAFLGPCPGDGYGPQADVSLDLDTPALRDLLKAPQPPTFLVAKVRFLQSDGTPLPGEQGPLEAHIPLRCY